MAQEIVMPDLGSGIEEGILINWLKQPGDTINDGDVIAEVETDKATVEVPVNVSGTIVELKGKAGDSLAVGSVIGYVGEAGESAPSGGQQQAAPAPSNGGGQTTQAQQAPTPAATKQEETRFEPAEADGNLPDGVRASPVARKMAQERGINLQSVQGSGPQGRIVKADIEGYQAPAAQPAKQAAAPSGIAAPSYGKLPEGPDVEIIETSKLRTRIANRMVESKQQVPHFYVTTEMDTAAMIALRKQINADLDDEHKVTVNDLIVKAAAVTLRDFPNLNTHYYGENLVRYKRINIGIAVALPQGGLINVVAKDADRVPLSQMAATNKAMIARAREGKLKPDDMAGSTFTVSNLGAYDVDHFIAIINPPEAGILAIGSAKTIPIVGEDGSLTTGSRMKVTISVDHRVSDGAEGAQYLQRFKHIIEHPMLLLV